MRKVTLKVLILVTHGLLVGCVTAQSTKWEQVNKDGSKESMEFAPGTCEVAGVKRETSFGIFFEDLKGLKGSAGYKSGEEELRKIDEVNTDFAMQSRSLCEDWKMGVYHNRAALYDCRKAALFLSFQKLRELKEVLTSIQHNENTEVKKSQFQNALDLYKASSEKVSGKCIEPITATLPPQSPPAAPVLSQIEGYRLKLVPPTAPEDISGYWIDTEYLITASGTIRAYKVTLDTFGSKLIGMPDSIKSVAGPFVEKYSDYQKLITSFNSLVLRKAEDAVDALIPHSATWSVHICEKDFRAKLFSADDRRRKAMFRDIGLAKEYCDSVVTQLKSDKEIIALLEKLQLENKELGSGIETKLHSVVSEYLGSAKN